MKKTIIFVTFASILAFFCLAMNNEQNVGPNNANVIMAPLYDFYGVEKRKVPVHLGEGVTTVKKCYFFEHAADTPGNKRLIGMNVQVSEPSALKLSVKVGTGEDGAELVYHKNNSICANYKINNLLLLPEYEITINKK